MLGINSVKLEFWAGNPQVSLVNGEITIVPFANKHEDPAAYNDLIIYHSMNGSRYLCAHEVPQHVSIADFCEFICPPGSTLTNSLQGLRVLKGPDAATYIIAIKLRSRHDAVTFVQ